MISGHFFCDHCNDVVNVHFTGSDIVDCPTCRKHTARWVKHLSARNGGKLIDAPLAGELFAKLKGAVKL